MRELEDSGIMNDVCKKIERKMINKGVDLKYIIKNRKDKNASRPITGSGKKKNQMH